MSNNSAPLIQFSREYWQIVDDLFQRLPSRDLIFGCRGACAEWHARIVQTRQGQSMLQRRANLISSVMQNLIVYKDAYRALFENQSNELQEPHQQCISLVWLIYKHWHQQLILQSFRRANLELAQTLTLVFERRLEEFSIAKKQKNETKKEKESDFIHQETNEQVAQRITEMLQNVQEAAHGLQFSVLEDENDILAEQTYRNIALQGEKEEE